MPRELGDLPGSETREDAHRQLAALRLQTTDLLLDVHLGIGGDVLELLDFRFELGDRLFEIEERNSHALSGVIARCGRVRGAAPVRKL